MYVSMIDFRMLCDHVCMYVYVIDEGCVYVGLKISRHNYIYMYV